MENETRAIIVEDMEAYLQTIERMVMSLDPDIKIVGKATTLDQAKRLIREHTPHLLLLDIQFEAEGKTAFDLLLDLENHDNEDYQVIFITAHQEKEYYAKAFDLGAIHFIEKPIDPLKLKEALVRARKNREKHEPSDWLTQVQQVHRQWHNGLLTGKIMVEGSKFNEIVEVSALVLLEADGRCTNLCLNDGRILKSSHNLGDFEKKLAPHPSFFRIHHNKILNLNYIRRFSRRERIIELTVPVEKQVSSKERFRLLLKYMETMG